MMSIAVVYITYLDDCRPGPGAFNVAPTLAMSLRQAINRSEQRYSDDRTMAGHVSFISSAVLKIDRTVRTDPEGAAR